MDIKYILSCLWIIFLSICSAFIFYQYIIKKKILQPLCLLDSNTCLRVEYYNFHNSALFQVKNSGLWIWFNGDRAFVYGQPVGQICEQPDKFTAAYALNTKTGAKEGYVCVDNLEKVLQFYKDKGVSPKYFFKKPSNYGSDIFDILNMFNEEGIINLSSSGN